MLASPRSMTALLKAAVVGVLMLSLLNAVPSTARPFKYRSYIQMVEYLKELNATYPEILRVYVAQDKYNLPYPKELTCIGDDDTGELVPCQHFVVHITNHSTLAANPTRPQVFFSGALHGDERIGPITTIEMIAMVAKFATAFAHPDSPDTAALKATASLHTQRWLHHLVNTRDVVITPMTNAYGYSHDQRTELAIDPNRDYNYMRHGEHCMQTMTSRVVNEIWRDHMFQLAITFHGGMRAISYEWGSPNHNQPDNAHRSQKSPDDAAQAQLSNTLALYAGAFADKTLYPTGTMNDVVYGVTGGMEDWGYAASWENQFVPDDEHKPFKPCKPSTFGGYDEAKTVYNNLTHRAFNILVETSNDKHPMEKNLGRFEDLYSTELDFYTATKGVPSLGHVTQNVRVALMLIDMVEPYIRWVHAPLELPTVEESFENDAIADMFPSANLFVADKEELTSLGCGGYALSSAHVAACNTTECAIEHDGTKPLKLQLAWEVLGAISVDKTKVQLATDPSFSDDAIVWESAIQKGKTRRFFELPEQDATGAIVENPLFVSCLDLSAQKTRKLFARAVAVVDQNWKKQAAKGSDEPSPHIPAQSHYVNARTNPKWSEEWNGRRIQGTLNWFSPTIQVTVETTGAYSSPATPKSSGSESSDQDDIEEEEEDQGEIAVEPDFQVTKAPVPTKTLAPATTSPPETAPVTTSPPATSEVKKNQTSAGVLKTDLRVNDNTSSLLGYGYLTLGLGGLIIMLTLTYLYKRVFRSKRRAYMNINRQNGPQRSARPARSANNQEDDEEDDDDEEEDDDDVGTHKHV